MAIITHPCLAALIKVTTKPPVSRVNKTVLTNTDVGARGVLTLALQTDPRVLKTLIHVNTGQAGGGQSKARQALTAECSVHICTFSIGAHSCLPTLIVVYALGPVCRGVEPRRAVALKIPHSVPASPSLTHSLQALVLIPASSVSSLLISWLALAPVALHCVNTDTVRTEVRLQGALVNIPGDLCWYPRNLAQQPVLVSVGRGAGGTQVRLLECPALPHTLAAAAVYPGQLERHLVEALPTPGEGGEAVSLPSIQASLPILCWYEARLAYTVEPGVSVHTASPVTGVGSCLTLVLVHTLLLLIHHSARRTDTVERPDSVDTVTPITQT